MSSFQTCLRKGSLFVVLVAVGCGEGLSGPDDVQQVAGDVRAAGTPPDAAATISFDAFSDDVSARAATTTRTLIRSAAGYQSFFGHAPPPAVDFSRDWVMFYAAGTEPTGGYGASFVAVLRAGTSLIAITQLSSPGASCPVTQVLTAPYALIKFPKQPGTSAQFYKSDTIVNCGTDQCAGIKCADGGHCDPATGKCISQAIFCGGIGGIPCPGAGKCVDNPNDSCDPKAGGADCGGICSCPKSAVCDANTNWDPSPSVCACVPVKPPVCGPVCDIYCDYGNVLDANGCPTCKCNPPPADPCATVKCAAGTHCDAGKCAPDAVSCGGFIGKPCPGLGKCVDNPKDTCDPAAGGADCPGICSCVQNVLCTTNSRFDSSPSVCACVPVKPPVCGPVCDIYCDYGNALDANGCRTCKCNPPPIDPCETVKCAAGTHCDAGKCAPDAVSCGGFIGKPCPGLGKCVDNPKDTCDPTAGGADCPGICSCVQNVLCTTNSRFDSSPSVCACVPVTPGICTKDMCPGVGPLGATMICADGTTAGPVCAPTADGVCGWKVTTCPPAQH